MSSHSSPAPAASSGGGSERSALRQLISAREASEVPTVLDNIAKVVGSTWQAVRDLFATVTDAGLGLTEAALALPNNVVGYLSQNILNHGIIRPLHETRGKLLHALTGK